MNIYKTAVSIENDSSIYSVDTIEYEEKLWLVPSWLEAIGKSQKKPERIICLTYLGFQKTKFQGFDYLLNNPMPKDVLFGQIPSKLKNEYTILMSPDIWCLNLESL